MTIEGLLRCYEFQRTSQTLCCFQNTFVGNRIISTDEIERHVLSAPITKLFIFCLKDLFRLRLIKVCP